MNNIVDTVQYGDTGAIRESQDEKARIELISPFALERLGLLLGKGAHKYAARNWEAGMPQQRTLASLLRHVIAYQQGKTDEDHLASIMANAMFLLDIDERIKRGLLSEEWDDMPHYNLVTKENVDEDRKDSNSGI